MAGQYIDDPETPDDAVLWRYIKPEYIKPDGTASSAAYRTKHLSAYVVATVAQGNPPRVTTEQALRAKYPGMRFQCFTAKAARDAGCIIAPIPDETGDHSHREVCPADDPHSRLRKEADKLKAAAQWVDGDAPLQAV